MSTHDWERPPLLPHYSSELERALDVALSHIEQVDIDLSALWDPWKCPLPALPYLAWAVKVLQWHEDWSEVVKRQVVASALDVHRVCGSRLSVERALQSLGVRTRLVEWFESKDPSAVPGTFHVEATVPPGGWGSTTQEMVRRIKEVVTATKPASRPFTLSVCLSARGGLSMAANLRLTRRAALKMHADSEWVHPISRLNSGVGMAANLRFVFAKKLIMR